MNIDSRILTNQNEGNDFRIAQLENALAELLVEIKSSTNPISGRVLKAWGNANLVLNEKNRN